MKTKLSVVTTNLLLVFMPLVANGQMADSVWSLQKCIDYALQKNIQIQKSTLSNEVNYLSAEQAKASRFPSLNASVSQNFGWSKTLGINNQFGDYSGSNGTNYGLNSSVTLYNGFKVNNTIKQSKLVYEAALLNTETIKEDISLNVLDSYLQVLYAEEQVKNCLKQLEITSSQLSLAEERQRLGLISKADFLQIKSQFASENSTLANAEKSLAINKLNLLQLMELPASANLVVGWSDSAKSVNQNRQPIADSVFVKATDIKPQIKSAALDVQSAQIDEKIAKAGYGPGLTLTGGLSTGYSSSMDGIDYSMQVKNKINPSVGLTLHIPIYQNRQVKTQVAKSKIGVKTAELNELNTHNALRKSIEQACVDVLSAQKAYEASMEGFNAAQESYQVADEKFKNGMISSIDFLVSKTNLITAESNLLQSKYSLIFSYKTLDFYSGTPLTF